MHQTARQECESPGQHQCHPEQRHHDPAMLSDMTPTGGADGIPQAHKGHSRQKMDGAERSKQPKDMDEEARGRDKRHQTNPDIAKHAMVACSLRPPELQRAKQGGRQGGKSMKGDR